MVKRFLSLLVAFGMSLIAVGKAFAVAATDGPTAIALFVPELTSVWGLVGLVLTAAAVMFVVRKLIKTGWRC